MKKWRTKAGLTEGNIEKLKLYDYELWILDAREQRSIEDLEYESN